MLSCSPYSIPPFSHLSAFLPGSSPTSTIFAEVFISNPRHTQTSSPSKPLKSLRNFVLFLFFTHTLVAWNAIQVLVF
ncbi:hypothetical protein F5Y14DRAFT_406221 [Nemania sp. NC0429]|nr:hypothetical protein F5Y14DRAFT_406221 [Nemania sp. NC0429]